MTVPRLPRLFPPSSTFQGRWRARILSATLLTSIPLTLGLMVVSYLLTPGFSVDLVLLAVILIFEIGVWALWHVRGLNQAAHVLVLGAWAVVSIAVFYSGGISSASTLSQLFVVVIAALLTSTTITLGVVAATGGMNALALFLELDQRMPDPWFIDAPEIRFAIQLAIMFLTAATLLHSTGSFRHLVQNLSDSERRFRALFEKSSDAVFLFGLDRKVIEANENASKLLGYKPHDLVGLPMEKLILVEDRTSFLERFEQVQEEEVLAYTHVQFQTKTGEQIVMEVNLSIVRDDRGKPLHYQSTGRDVTAKVTEDRQLQSTLAHMAVKASTDYLTGILNRDAILQHCQAEWARHLREKKPLSIMLVDMDRLKYINDNYGHPVGDQALKKLVEVLDKHRRAYDWLGRFGGDEFMVVLPGATLSMAQDIARRMLGAIRRERIKISGGELEISCSIGVASTTAIDRPPTSVMDLVKAADAALYAAKPNKPQVTKNS